MIFTNEIRSSAEILISSQDISDSVEIRIRAGGNQEDDYILLDDIYVEICEPTNFTSDPISGRSSDNVINSILEQPKVFPNPFMDELTVEMHAQDYSSASILNIYDMKGQLIISRKITDRITKLDLSTLPDGQVYLTQIIEPSNQTHNFRIVKL